MDLTPTVVQNPVSSSTSNHSVGIPVENNTNADAMCSGKAAAEKNEATITTTHQSGAEIHSLAREPAADIMDITANPLRDPIPSSGSDHSPQILVNKEAVLTYPGGSSSGVHTHPSEVRKGKKAAVKKNEAAMTTQQPSPAIQSMSREPVADTRDMTATPIRDPFPSSASAHFVEIPVNEKDAITCSEDDVADLRAHPIEVRDHLNDSSLTGSSSRVAKSGVKQHAPPQEFEDEDEINLDNTNIVTKTLSRQVHETPLCNDSFPQRRQESFAHQEGNTKQSGVDAPHEDVEETATVTSSPILSAHMGPEVVTFPAVSTKSTAA
ncbi:hypothetical protein HK102_000116 [Quaeritorhiza haematococci]|nr:hypothetical protein HK102_000116 [Quaeritorhiza haematococci]